MVPRARVWLLPALACLAPSLALVAPSAVATNNQDQLTLDAPARGQRAIDALGEDLGTAAAANGLTTRALREILTTDKTAWVDTTGRVFFKDPLPSGTAATEEVEPPAHAVGDVFALHSKSGSQHVIFLDFDGSTVSGTAWNASPYFVNATVHPAWTLDGDPSSFDTSERDAIASIWARVAEDYAPFDVDVTTQDPGAAAIDRTNGSDPTYGTRVLVSPSDDAITKICPAGCGGVAYIDVFDASSPDHAYYQPAWVFPQALSNSTKNIAEAASHEAGHNFGLSHDGVNAGSAYYSGHAMWAPIMGTGYTRPVVQWSQGEYAGANNTENDLAIIAANGAPLRTDEDGGSIATAATALPTGPAYITSRTDQDFYALGSCTGPLSLAASPAATSPDLDIQLALLDTGGAAVASANPASAASSTDVANGMAASLSPSVATSSYFLRVDGVGNGTGATGYSDYASIGAYTLTISGNCTTVTPPAPVSPPSAPQSLTASVRADQLEADLHWAAPAVDGGGAVLGYQLVVDNAVVGDVSAGETAATLTGLDEGETYAVEVRAHNSAGLGAPAQTSFTVPNAPVVATVTTPPSAPRIGGATSGARGGRSTATAAWSPPPSDGGSAITGYQVVAQRLDRSGKVVHTVTGQWLGAGARSVTLRLPKGRYRFVVHAHNAMGVSPWSAVSKVVRAR
jgi:hypothetical protein